MATTFTWNIESLETEAATGFVKAVHYTITANDGEHEVTHVNVANLYGDLKVPYNELSEDICIDWCKRRICEEIHPRLGDNPVPWNEATDYKASIAERFIERQLTKRLSVIKEELLVTEPFSDTGAIAAVMTLPEERRRARNADGTFKGDDPSTPDVNEAWES